MNVNLNIAIPDGITIGSSVHVPQVNENGAEILTGKVTGVNIPPLTDITTQDQTITATNAEVTLDDNKVVAIIPIDQVFTTAEECETYIQNNPDLFTSKQ